MGERWLGCEDEPGGMRMKANFIGRVGIRSCNTVFSENNILILLFFIAFWGILEYNNFNRVAQSCKALGTSWGFCLSFLLIKELVVWT